MFSQEGEDAASASATGSAAAPAKGAPKSAQANSKLRVLHIAIHKHGHSIASIKEAISRGGLGEILDSYTEHGADNFGTHGDLLMVGHELQNAVDYAEFLRDPSNAGKSVEEA